MMGGIKIYKLSGSGNDFILINNMKGDIRIPAGKLAKTLCRRKYSVGADGLIILEKSDVSDFSWRFHNADGSEAGMCGNGGRCAARFAYMLGIAGKTMSFETKAGTIQAHVDGKHVKIHLTDPFDLKRNIELPIDERTRVVSFINTGVPHVVKIVPEVENLDVAGIGRKIRFHDTFRPSGANVNFVRIIDTHTISVRTYERGVEGETLACGTGAVASAIVASLGGKLKSPVNVKTRGGEVLTIHFSIEHGEFKETCLEGGTEFVFVGEVQEEALTTGA